MTLVTLKGSMIETKGRYRGDTREIQGRYLDAGDAEGEHDRDKAVEEGEVLEEDDHLVKGYG